MSTLTAEPANAPISSDVVKVERVTGARVLNSEWIKLRSLRSTAVTLATAVSLMVAMGWIIGWATDANWSDSSPEERASFSPVDVTLAGYYLAQLAVGVLGVLTVTGEYATGMIRATFGAVPRRLPVLWAKSTLYAGVTFVLMLAAGFAAFVGGQELLGTHGTDLSATGAVRAIVGVAGYLALIGVFSVALGFIVRSTGGGVAILCGLLLVVPTLGLLLPSSWRDHLLPYLPSNAGSTMFSARTAPDALSASTSLLVLLAWVAAALAGAAVLVKRRDA
ncbi:MAG: ABC transporter permease [Actinomycetes bacterium]